MKKLLILVIALAIISGVAFAGDNQSAKYIRILSREAATDSIDIAYFNPAGTAFLQEGFHVQLNGQTIYLNYSHTNNLNATDYSMQNWIPFVPSAYLGYASGKWAAFASYTIPEGGGSLDYDLVSLILPGPSVEEGSLIASSATHAISVGGSYQITPMFSVGIRGEMSIGSDSFDADFATLGGAATLKTSGIGYGGTFGMHFRPMEELNFSVTVESAQKIDMEEKDSSGNPGTLGVLRGAAPTNVDRPWKIRSGLSYAFPFGLEIPVSFKYNFWKAVDDTTLQNSWSTSMGMRFWLTEGLEISVGGSYATGNVQDSQIDTSYLNPELNSITLAGGIGWEIIENLNLDNGVLYPFYTGADGTAFSNLNSQVIDMVIGIGYVF